MHQNKALVIASAGGHLTQAMCATSYYENIVLVCNKRTINNKKISKIYKVIDTQKNPLIHLINFFYAFLIIIKEKPKCIISTGGPIAIPFLLVGKIISIKVIYIDTLSRVVELSNTGRMVKRLGLFNDFFCQWPDIAKSNDVNYVGKCFDILSQNSYNPNFEIRRHKPLILVTLGTNGYSFKRLLDLISETSLYTDNRVEWLIQSGGENLDSLPTNGKVVDLVSRDEMESYVKNASLIISHCGIGSINLMLSYRKKVIFVPRVSQYGEFSDDHQLQIAKELNTDIFHVVYPESTIELPSFEEIENIRLVKNSVDITNYDFARIIKSLI